MSHQPRRSQPSAQLPLLQTKLQPPPARATVARPRLLHRLDAALHSKLTLVSAPAGFGKSTLVADWMTHTQARATQTVKSAWVSLDEGDSTIHRFLLYLIAALQRTDEHIGRGLPDALRASESPGVEAILTALINDVVAATEDGTRIVLTLDDYHLADAPRIDAALTFLIEHLPPQMHLVIVSRIDPSLPLARLRARGQITEIREHDLRFTDDEAALFLRERMGLALADSDIQSVQARTEGWISGLQLSAIALRDQPESAGDLVAQLAGSHRYIMDYLLEEVFERQPAEIQQFLLDTAILRRMCAPLCNALRGRTDSQQLLERLERSNLFVVPLDSQRQWYRYHQLFADLLQQRLQRSSPDVLLMLHGRASDWFAALAESSTDAEAIDEAMRHALLARDSGRAVALLDRWSDQAWERGGHDTLRQWLAAMPPDAATTPRIDIVRGWLAFTGGQYDAAESSLHLAEQQLDDSPVTRELRGRIAATRAFISTFRGDFAGTLRFAQAALELLQDQGSSWRSSAAIALGDARSLTGDLVAAEAAYRDALASRETTGNVYLSLNAGYKLAATLRQRGLLQLAFDLCAQQIAVAERHGLAQTTMAGSLYALRGDVQCEWNNLADALAQTRQAIDATTHATHLGLVGWIYLSRIRCLIAAREIDQAEASLQELESRGGAALPPWIASPVAAMRVLIQFARGNLPGAAALLSDRGLAPDDAIAPGRDLEYVTFARVLAAQRRLTDARRLVARLIERSMSQQRASLTVPLLILRAQIEMQQDDSQQALDTISHALRMGEAGKFTRVFLDGGATTHQLLQAAMSHGISPDYTRRLLDAFGSSAAPTTHGNLRESLSEREREVLRLIAAGLKNQEIADTLVISLNTVLYHTKNIYGKLGVSHRTQAVQRARELQVL